MLQVTVLTCMAVLLTPVHTDPHSCGLLSTPRQCLSQVIHTTWWWPMEGQWAITACPVCPPRARPSTAAWTAWARAISRTYMPDKAKTKSMLIVSFYYVQRRIWTQNMEVNHFWRERLGKRERERNVWNMRLLSIYSEYYYSKASVLQLIRTREAILVLWLIGGGFSGWSTFFKMEAPRT